jgi:hypothetical protein
MLGEPLRLRSRREPRSPRRSRWRAVGLAAAIALVAGGACLAPVAPKALAPFAPGGVSPFGAVVQAPPPVAVEAPAVSIAPTNAPLVAVAVPPTRAVPTPMPVPTPLPQPTPAAPLGPDGLTFLANLRSDRESQWLKNHAETPLRAGPNEQTQMFTMLPQWSTLKQLQSEPGWLYVLYGGDGDTRQAGPGWIRASDAGGIGPPTIWLRSNRSITVFGSPDPTANRSLDVPPSTLMEVIGPQIIQGQRVHVRLPGDGRGVPPAQGWVEVPGLARARAPSFFELPAAYPDVLTADIRLKVPYRTQLDGTEYAGANCGPTVLGMALEAFGVNLPQPLLRGDALVSGELNPEDDDSGTYIWALARVAENNGVSAHGLYDDDGSYHRWTLDEVRASVRSGRPVIAQVVYRGLPGREASSYYGDHYVVITGLVGDDFLYNDPIGGLDAAEPPGWDRIMSPTELRRAMRASDTPYAYTAFGLGRN